MPAIATLVAYLQTPNIPGIYGTRIYIPFTMECTFSDRCKIGDMLDSFSIWGKWDKRTDKALGWEFNESGFLSATEWLSTQGFTLIELDVNNSSEVFDD